MTLESLIYTCRGLDGLDLTVERWASPGGQPVILLHGGGQTRNAWGETGRRLRGLNYDVSAMDLRGHGDSAWSGDQNYTLSAYRDDLAMLLAQVDFPAVVVGASLGGIAALLAAGERERLPIKALVLVDIAPTRPAGSGERILRFMRAAPEGFASVDEAADAVAAYLPHRPRPATTQGLLKNLRTRNGRLHWHWDPEFIEVASEEHVRQPQRLEVAAGNVRCPTLLLRGSLSEVVSDQDVNRLRQLIPHSEVLAVPGARHMLAGDQNTAFGTALVDFLQREAPADP